MSNRYATLVPVFLEEWDTDRYGREYKIVTQKKYIWYMVLLKGFLYILAFVLPFAVGFGLIYLVITIFEEPDILISMMIGLIIGILLILSFTFVTDSVKISYKVSYRKYKCEPV